MADTENKDALSVDPRATKGRCRLDERSKSGVEPLEARLLWGGDI
jgi:hypothetical protein